MATLIQTIEYPVYIGTDALKELNAFLKKNDYSLPVFILLDENVEKHCLDLLLNEAPELKTASIIKIQSGEEHKSIDTCKEIWTALTNAGADRKSLLINLGGGVIGDMGGFAAATYKRGINFVNVPTTLLAQVDASIGGKVAVDLDNLKNQVGLFAYPKAIFINPDFLKTLDKRQLTSGFAEVIKHALIRDKAYWNQIREISDLNNVEWGDIIQRSVEIKKAVVEEDPKEQGLRKILNFGHTIGHAIETYSITPEYNQGHMVPLLHGEAISIGMICEAWLSLQQHENRSVGITEEELSEIENIVFRFFPKFQISKINKNVISDLMLHDKKNQKAQINFTLLDTVGEASYDHYLTEIFPAFDHYVQATGQHNEIQSTES